MLPPIADEPRAPLPILFAECKIGDRLLHPLNLPCIVTDIDQEYSVITIAHSSGRTALFYAQEFDAAGFKHIPDYPKVNKK